MKVGMSVISAPFGNFFAVLSKLCTALSILVPAHVHIPIWKNFIHFLVWAARSWKPEEQARLLQAPRTIDGSGCINCLFGLFRTGNSVGTNLQNLDGMRIFIGARGIIPVVNERNRALNHFDGTITFHMRKKTGLCGDGRHGKTRLLYSLDYRSQACNSTLSEYTS
ncbi:hypothetical protein IW262DRAFT_1479913 [Armillaria fumosa]|nr:hypothetical protein IW262DRAFT_1479913 [Armillaria fumosa]